MSVQYVSNTYCNRAPNVLNHKNCYGHYQLIKIHPAMWIGRSMQVFNYIQNTWGEILIFRLFWLCEINNFK